MKTSKFLAMMLAIAMVVSLTPAVMTEARAEEPGTYSLKLVDVVEQLTGTGTYSEIGGSIYTIDITKKVSIKREETYTFDTKSGEKITGTTALELNNGTSISFDAPDAGTLYLYFSNGDKIDVKAGESEPVSYAIGDSKIVAVKTTANEKYSVTRKSGTSRNNLAYIEWVQADETVEVESNSVRLVINGLESSKTKEIDVTVSGFKSAGKSIFAVPSEKDIVDAKIEAENVGLNGNGSYKLTLMVGSKAGTATVYVGMDGNTVSDVSAAESVVGVQKINVTVMSETSTSERNNAISQNALYYPAIGLSDISSLAAANTSKLVIVLEDNGTTKAIGTKTAGTGTTTWLHDVTVNEDANGKFLNVTDESEYVFTITEAFKPGPAHVDEGKLKIGSQCLDVLNLRTTGNEEGPLTGEDKAMRIYFADGKFYLRGSNGSSFFGHNGSSYVALKEENTQQRVPVEIYIKAAESSIPITYHDYEGNIVTTQYGNGSFVPPVPEDINVDGKDYTILGWAKAKPTDSLLSSDGEKYSNLYGYTKDGGYGFLGTLGNQFSGYGIIPYDKGTVGAFASETISGTEMDLYPVYVQAGRNTTAVANGPGTTEIAITSTADSNTTDPRWLGSIKVAIYNDGELVGGEEQTLFFHYNSDDMVDLELVLTYDDEDKDKYVINGVVAVQGGSSSSKDSAGNNKTGGLKCSINYLKTGEGKLDNVVGGTTVKVYMSTRYTPKFYLDGVEKAVADISDKWYSSDENVNEFNSSLTDAASDPVTNPAGKYIIAPENIATQYTGNGFVKGDETYFDGTKTGDNDYFGIENIIAHGSNYLFGYFVETYEHQFTVPSASAISTEELLNGDDWVLVGNEGTLYSGMFNVTPNTQYATDGIFRFYAYTTGSLTISKVVDGDMPAPDQEFKVNVTFDNVPEGAKLPESGTGYTVAGNTATVTVKAGESVTIDKIPTGTTYTVSEDIAAGFSPTFSATTSTIARGVPDTVTVTNTYSAAAVRTGSLTVDMKVEPETSTHKNDDFTITVTFDNWTPPAGLTGDHITGVDGKTVTLTLKDGESAKIPDIPVGATYTVAEDSGSAAGATSVTITSNGQGTINEAEAVTVTNTYSGSGNGGGTGGTGGGTGGGQLPPPQNSQSPQNPQTGGDKTDKLDKSEHYGYIIGVPGDEVRPEQTITRAEIATILFRLLTDEAREEFWGETSPFEDVSTKDWFNHAVSTLYKLGIVEGDGTGKFNPDQAITRGEIAAMVVRFYEKADDTKIENRFSDVDETKWYAEYALLADYHGLMEGDGDRFKPEDSLLRAEAMTVFNRLLGRKPHAEHLLEDMIKWPDNTDTGKWYYAQVQEATNSHECADEDVTVNGEVFEVWSRITPMRDWEALEYTY